MRWGAQGVHRPWARGHKEALGAKGAGNFLGPQKSLHVLHED